MPRPVDKPLRALSKIDLSILPTNAFCLRGDEFYALVKELTSDDIEELFRIQKVSNARCLLNTNVLTFFDISSNDPLITQLQDRLSFTVADGKRVIRAGVHGFVEYLRSLFASSLTKPTSKRISSNNISAKTNLSHQTHSTPTQTSPLLPSSSTTASSFDSYHHQFLTDKIQSWWTKIRDNYGLADLVLKQPDDYQVIINGNAALVQCCCNKQIKIPMPKGRKNDQLSNFYKQITNVGQCTAIERKRKRTESDDDGEDPPSPVSPSLIPAVLNGSHPDGSTQLSKQSTR